MSDQYVVVDSERNVYYFDEKRLYEFLNKGPEDEWDEDGEGTESYTVLDSFPLPETDYDSSDHDLGHDDQGRYYGDYCPFGTGEWASNAVFILKNGATFVPEKKERTKTVTVVEYGPPEVKSSVKKAPAKKAAAKKARK